MQNGKGTNNEILNLVYDEIHNAIRVTGSTSGGSGSSLLKQKIISSNYILTDEFNYYLIDNLTSDIEIEIPHTSILFLKDKMIHFYRIDNSDFNVYIKLEDFQNQSVSGDYAIVEIPTAGKGLRIVGNINNTLDYTDFSIDDLVINKPDIKSISIKLNDNTLTTIGDVYDKGTTLDYYVSFQYREVGTSTWYSAIAQYSNEQSGTFTFNSTVDNTKIYEGRFVFENNVGFRTYGEIILMFVWVDLRAGGEVLTDGNAAGNDIRYRAGMTMERDADGMFFTGFGPWSSWVKFEKYIWNRGDDKTLIFIMKNLDSSMMIGIGSDATDEASNSQYSQAEVEFYFNTATDLWGLYGNNGTVGTYGNQMNSVSIPANAVLKLIIESDGDLGDTVSIYQLPSANESDWDDISNLLGSWNIGGSLNPDEPNIMPFIIPRNGGSQRFVAFKV